MENILMKITRLTVNTLLLSFLVLCFTTKSQSAVLIDPPNQLFSTSAGDSVDQVIGIVNPSEETLKIRAYIQDWHYDPSGKPEYVETNSLPRSASNWITFNPSELTLESEESGTIRYTVDVPSEIGSGTYWSILFLEGESLEAQDDIAIASFSVRVGHVIYVNIPPIEKAGSIAGILGQAPEDPSQSYQLAVQYFNNGNAAQGVEGTFELRDSFGETVRSALIDRNVILPESLRVLVMNFYGPLPAGDYTALFILNYGDEEVDVAGEYSFRLEAPLIDPESLNTSEEVAEAVEEDSEEAGDLEIEEESPEEDLGEIEDLEEDLEGTTGVSEENSDEENSDEENSEETRLEETEDSEGASEKDSEEVENSEETEVINN